MARRRRQLTLEERSLWQRLTRDVRPIAPAREPDDLSSDNIEHSAAGPAAKSARLKPKRAAVQRPVIGATAPRQKTPPLMEAGDPRQARHVARGRRQIDATLDLHGLTQDQAFASLSRFLEQARMMGFSTVLVITGKGAPQDIDAPSYTVSRGILRRRFLDWADGPFRDHISSVRQSHQKHGGAGAFYVFLKKQKRSY